MGVLLTDPESTIPMSAETKMVSPAQFWDLNEFLMELVADDSQ